ncbi:hypothetical protein SRCM100623_02794 [Acetobacter pasteurianus]|uniref:Uncharacterized protein n=2 Tax=Acetobacter pasteurianus TaxID=438 RepID=A0AAC9SLH8_ACEPA|nr:hypothetical protein S101468_00743 [Acetobacter pasteurianus subsp. pasteurianus]OAZ61291.1 hypothetical protein SRCM100623_02794 [Acetobacter pasteurianus]
MYDIAVCEKCGARFEVAGNYSKSTFRPESNWTTIACIKWHEEHPEDGSWTKCTRGKEAVDKLTSQWPRR